MELSLVEAMTEISIHALREESDTGIPFLTSGSGYFYPRPPRGERHRRHGSADGWVLFLSTPSARRATHGLRRHCQGREISIHALREESDPGSKPEAIKDKDFYPRPPRGERRGPSLKLNPIIPQFLSTPSARRATSSASRGTSGVTYFYPRPPRGERRLHGHRGGAVQHISIHALREESDVAL